MCMFRVFSSYRTPEKAKHWFEAQGLKGVITDTYTANGEVMTRVHVYNRPRDTNRVYVARSTLFATLLKHLRHSEGFSAFWNKNGELLGVRFETSTM